MEDERGWLHKGSALIRAILHLDPDNLSDNQWCYQVKMALWVEFHTLQKQQQANQF